MSTVEYKLPLTVTDIEKILPHRFPFLLIDRVVEIEEDKRLVAIKHVSASDRVLQGHFPGNPVMPGVLQIEAIAQASGILGMLNLPRGCQVLLGEVSNARFKKPVIPGDSLKIEVKLLKQRTPFFWYEGTASVDGEVVTSVKLSALLVAPDEKQH